MPIIVIHAWTTHYPDPIRFDAGSVVEAGREDTEHPGWFWCRGPEDREGWVHCSFLAGAAGITTGVRAYSAGELTVAGGERGELLESLDGWARIRLNTGAGAGCR